MEHSLFLYIWQRNVIQQKTITQDVFLCYPRLWTIRFSYRCIYTSFISLYIHQFHIALYTPVSYRCIYTSFISLYVNQFHIAVYTPVSFRCIFTSFTSLYIHQFHIAVCTPVSYRSIYTSFPRHSFYLTFTSAIWCTKYQEKQFIFFTCFNIFTSCKLYTTWWLLCKDRNLLFILI